jgi:hypothetical protein
MKPANMIIFNQTISEGLSLYTNDPVISVLTQYNKLYYITYVWVFGKFFIRRISHWNSKCRSKFLCSFACSGNYWNNLEMKLIL